MLVGQLMEEVAAQAPLLFIMPSSLRTYPAAVWQQYLVSKIRSVLEKAEATIICIARSLPEALGLALLNKLQHCGGRLFGIKENDFVTLYLWTDPHQLHEQFLGHFEAQLTIQGFIATGDFTLIMKADSGTKQKSSDHDRHVIRVNVRYSPCLLTWPAAD